MADSLVAAINGNLHHAASDSRNMSGNSLFNFADRTVRWQELVPHNGKSATQR